MDSKIFPVLGFDSTHNSSECFVQSSGTSTDMNDSFKTDAGTSSFDNKEIAVSAWKHFV